MPTEATVSGFERNATAASAVPAPQVISADASSPVRWYIWPISAIDPPNAAAAMIQNASPIAAWSRVFSSAPPTYPARMMAKSAATRASRGMASQLAATKIRMAAPNNRAAIIARIEPKLSDLRSIGFDVAPQRIGRRPVDQPSLDPSRNVRSGPRRIARHVFSPSLVFFSAEPAKPLTPRHFPIRVCLCSRA